MKDLKKKPITYHNAGVNIDEGDRLVDSITPLVKKTLRPEVLAHLGGYAGLFELDLKKYKHPVLVSGTDGVGTKLKLAGDLKKYDTIGIDLVAMCVNDTLCCGAEPLFFLDYFATGKLERNVAKEIIAGIARPLAEINCTLIGGETAEMPGLYNAGDFDLAGFAVAVVEKNKIVDGSRIESGDIVIGLSSSGIHSNGYSLVRKILETRKINPAKDHAGFGKPIGEILLEPTRIYVNPVLKLLDQYDIRGIAHITGGGIVENVPRILPDNCKARFEKKAISTPAIFKKLQEWGNVPETEMWRVFNMGIGMVLVVGKNEAIPVIKELDKMGCPSSVIGKIESRTLPTQEVEIV